LNEKPLFFQQNIRNEWNKVFLWLELETKDIKLKNLLNKINEKKS
jgi:hypothetical protein